MELALAECVVHEQGVLIEGLLDGVDWCGVGSKHRLCGADEKGLGLEVLGIFVAQGQAGVDEYMMLTFGQVAQVVDHALVVQADKLIGFGIGTHSSKSSWLVSNYDKLTKCQNVRVLWVQCS